MVILIIVIQNSGNLRFRRVRVSIGESFHLEEKSAMFLSNACNNLPVRQMSNPKRIKSVGGSIAFCKTQVSKSGLVFSVKWFLFARSKGY